MTLLYCHKCLESLWANTVGFLLHRWNDMGNITHSKSTILVELVSKEETALFHTVNQTDSEGVAPQAACCLTSQLLICSAWSPCHERINSLSDPLLSIMCPLLPLLISKEWW